MSTVYASAPKNATLRFVALYLLTVGILVAVFSAFREKPSVADESIASQSAPGSDSLSLAGEAEAVKGQYKNELEKRDRTIAFLQSENRMLDSLNRNAVPVTRTVVAGGDGEWRQKYASVKASYDKLSEETKALERSYQTLADDNRRLVSQLRKSSPNQ